MNDQDLQTLPEWLRPQLDPQRAAGDDARLWRGIHDMERENKRRAAWLEANSMPMPTPQPYANGGAVRPVNALQRLADGGDVRSAAPRPLRSGGRPLLGDPNAGTYAPQRLADGGPVRDPNAFDPTEGMSNYDRFLAGAGKAFADGNRSIGSMFGLVSPEEIAEARRRDAPLMNTTAGRYGNIAGSTAGAIKSALLAGGALASAAPLAAAAGAARAGNALALLGRAAPTPAGITASGAKGALKAAQRHEAEGFTKPAPWDEHLAARWQRLLAPRHEVTQGYADGGPVRAPLHPLIDDMLRRCGLADR